MNQPSRVAYARRSTDPTRLHVPSHKLPVVVVPDLFGTRLSEGEELVWNPHGAPFHDAASPSPGPFKIDVERLAEVSAPLEPDEEHRFDRQSARERVAHIAHYYNLVPEWYHALVTALGGVAGETADRADLRTEATRRYRVHVRVYCCGYDWRLDNARSALRLAAVVDEALRETGAEKVVLVAHGMGGLVARYYCRCLGGEERVLRLVLVGSPTLGLPDAYSQLKNGLGGVYSQPYRDAIVALATRGGGGGTFDRDSRRVQDDAARTLATEGLLDAVDAVDSAVGAQSPGAFAERFFGGLYHKLCVATGEALTREATRDWVRQMPAMYQLLPTATWCRIHKSWLTFSPGATAYPPTGYMLVTPALLPPVESVIAAAAGSTALQEIEDGLADILGGSPAATRAMRNADTLVTFFRRARQALEGTDQDDFVNRAKAAVPRLPKIFTDCRSPRALYEDIYTGLLDVVEQRVACAGRLALARRFDDALTARPREETPASLGELARLTIERIRPALRGVPLLSAFATPARITPERARELRARERDHTLAGRDRSDFEQLDRQTAEDHDRDERRRRPKVYMHPNTVAIYGEGLRCPHPGMLLPTLVVSNDDSNVVLWRLVPNPADLLGDGLVPVDSAAPPDEWLTAPLRSRHARPRVEHRALTRDTATIELIKRAVEGVFAELVGDPHPEPASAPAGGAPT
jgi:pimeloyl-ACP methyl ester carboxylesterase